MLLCVGFKPQNCRDDKQQPGPGDLTDELQQQLFSATSSKSSTETKLTPEQLDEVRDTLASARCAPPPPGGGQGSQGKEEII
jgi:hypothetical protein